MADEIWELEPENAHPRARELMLEDFYWSVSDEDSPFGNDTGSNALFHFRKWRSEHPGEPVRPFLFWYLRAWEPEGDHWYVGTPEGVADLIEADEDSFMVRDQTLIAIALGQLVVEGRVDDDIRQLAFIALRRQATEPALELWPEGFEVERPERLAAIEKVLRQT